MRRPAPALLVVIAALGCSSGTAPPSSFPCSSVQMSQNQPVSCESTFEAQASVTPPIIGSQGQATTSGACGGYLVWLWDGMLFSFACIYDASTKMLVGTKQVTDTGVPCSGAGDKLPDSCLTPRTYEDAGTTD